MRHSAAIPLIGWERFWRSELERKETHILILFSRTFFFFCINVFALNQHPFCEMCEKGIWALACVYGNTAFRGVWRIIGLSCECLLERRSNQLQFVFCTERLSLLQWRIGVFSVLPSLSTAAEHNLPVHNYFLFSLVSCTLWALQEDRVVQADYFHSALESSASVCLCLYTSLQGYG